MTVEGSFWRGRSRCLAAPGDAAAARGRAGILPAFPVACGFRAARRALRLGGATFRRRMMLESSPGPLGRPRTPQGKRTLAKVLRERGVLSTAHAVDVTLDICDALAVAHANGVVHGQLGLACVRLVFTPEAGPRDLEIFTLVADDDSGVAGVVAPFQGPETRRDQPIDARADVWAIGALLYTMLVGAPLPPGAVEVPPGGMPMSLASIVEACLAPDPASRPQSVDEIAEKIASFATSPPDRFVRLAERRERRERAARVKRSLELRGLSEMPNVLDKLDDAALARAQRDTTTAITSLAVGTTTEAALERLMTAVHEGTDAARVELASGLPSLIDFDDDDDQVLPSAEQDETVPLVPVASPLANAHVALPEPPPPPPSASPSPAPSHSARTIAMASVAAVVLCLGLGYVGYALSSAPPVSSASITAATAPAVTTAPLPLTLTAAPTAASSEPPPIPVFVPSALPEALPITPASLPEAR